LHFKNNFFGIPITADRSDCGRWGHRPRRAAPVGVPPTGAIWDALFFEKLIKF